MSSFLGLVFVELFFLHTKTMTATTMITRPPIATTGITANGTSFPSGCSSLGSEMLILLFPSSSIFVIFSVMFSNLLGGVTVVTAISGTVVVSSVDLSVALVVLCVVLCVFMYFGGSGGSSTPGNWGGWGSDRNGGGWGIGLWPKLFVIVANTSVLWGMNPSNTVTHSE